MIEITKSPQEIEFFTSAQMKEVDFIETIAPATAAVMTSEVHSFQSMMSIPAALCDEALLNELNSIPDQMGFKIGDVADLLSIKQYVLRYWESEFEVLKPKKASNNQRLYTRKDVENAFLIRKLLHRDRFSIEGARQALKELRAHVRKEKDFSQVISKIENIQDRVDDLVADIRRARKLFL
jgi:DNA-binding transcriptional MerR regulator